MTHAERFKARLLKFRDRLLNTDTRNPSVFLRRVVKEKQVDLARLPAARTEMLWRRLLAGSGRAPILPDNDDADEARALRDALVALRRAADARFDETGLRDLYLGVAWIEGMAAEDVYIRGPLLLAPITLVHDRTTRPAGWRIELDEEAGILPNRSLLGVLRKHRNYRLPEPIDETIEELWGEAGEMESPPRGPDAVTPPLARIAAFLNRSGLAIAGVDPVLRAIEPLTKKLLRERPAPPDPRALRLGHCLVAGIFPQCSSALYADVEEMARRAEAGEIDQGIVDNLLDVPADDPRANEAHFAEMDLDRISESELNHVLSSDPSQDAIIAKAKRAECLVVRGPPGTGKSQVIVNLVADALARGDRVLVVCQKRAALDVVHERLAELGLDRAAWLVHDAKADRAPLYAKLNRAFTSERSAAPPARSSATIAAEMDAVLADLRAIVLPLGETRRGVTLSELYLAAQPGYRSRLSPSPALIETTLSELETTARGLAALQPGALRYDAPASPTSPRQSWREKGRLDRDRIIDALDRLVRILEPGPITRTPDDRALGIRATATDDHERLRGRWYRFFLPAWHRASAVVEANPRLGRAGWRDEIARGAEARRLLASLGGDFPEEWRAGLLERAEADAPLGDSVRVLRDYVATEFDRIVEHDIARHAIGAPAAEWLAAALAGLPAYEDWGEALRQEALLRWIDEIESAHPALRGEPFQRREELRARFERLAEEKRRAVLAEILLAWETRALVPSFAPGEAPGNRKAATQWNRLEYELGKKRRLKSLRALIDEFAWPLACGAPCWLASPEVVSEVFPLERAFFDLVVFDEASQLRVERSLPVLYRARRVVIAGDEQQMPPSRFFEAALEEDEEDEETEPLQVESLLELGKRHYGFDYLTWHYRSRRQELIDFSNHVFYEGKLRIAPNPEAAPGEPAIEWITVNGVWEKRGNLAEAEAIVDLIKREARRIAEAVAARGAGAFESIGVITFNETQMTHVLDAIDRRKNEDPDFLALVAMAENPPTGRLDDRLFVKNIENVQGDERDVILFSVGYAPDREGRFAMNFGPINNEGGENRLNVAVTRARRAIRVVASFDPTIMTVDNLKNPGPRRFKQYLRYARAVAGGRSEELEAVLSEIRGEAAVVEPATKAESGRGASVGAGAMRSIEEEVAAALVERGIEVRPHWGVGRPRIDLAVLDPRAAERFALGIECDGAAYHAPVAGGMREREIAAEAFLARRGWRLARIWSRDWRRRREAEIERLMKIIEESSNAPSKRLPPIEALEGPRPRGPLGHDPDPARNAGLQTGLVTAPDLRRGIPIPPRPPTPDRG
jgi:very-short-patch-repair endonuclease